MCRWAKELRSFPGRLSSHQPCPCAIKQITRTTWIKNSCEHNNVRAWVGLSRAAVHPRDGKAGTKPSTKASFPWAGGVAAAFAAISSFICPQRLVTGESEPWCPRRQFHGQLARYSELGSANLGLIWMTQSSLIEFLWRDCGNFKFHKTCSKYLECVLMPLFFSFWGLAGWRSIINFFYWVVKLRLIFKLAMSRVPSPPPPAEMSSGPVAESWCYTQVSPRCAELLLT